MPDNEQGGVHSQCYCSSQSLPMLLTRVLCNVHLRMYSQGRHAQDSCPGRSQRVRVCILAGFSLSQGCHALENLQQEGTRWVRTHGGPARGHSVAVLPEGVLQSTSILHFQYAELSITTESISQFYESGPVGTNKHLKHPVPTHGKH